MLTLNTLLIIFFIILIIYQIILAHNNSMFEGFDTNNSANSTYQPYDTNNPQNALNLAQQNAGNIQVLKQQVDGLIGLNAEVQDISGNVVTLQDQVNQLVASQKQYADNLTGGSAPNVTGTSTTPQTPPTSQTPSGS
jgi:hypothetical protein